MEKVHIEDVDSRIGPADVKRPLTRELGAEHVSLNYYELEPGESFAYGYHSHEKQEEVFYLIEGAVTFETSEATVEVGAGEAIRFAPGESQRGVNTSEERAVALAIGAPQDAGNLHMIRECVNCGFRTPNSIDLVEDGEAVVTICLECGMETGRYTD